MSSTLVVNQDADQGVDADAATHINTAAADKTGLTIRGFADQTHNLQEWQNSAGVWQAKINHQGRLLADQAQLKPDAGRALICSGDGSNNIIEVRDSDGVTQLMKMDKDGGLSLLSPRRGFFPRPDC